VNRELGEALARELGDAAAFTVVDVSDVEQVRELVDFAAKHMIEHSGGSIIDVTSIGGIQAGRGAMSRST
jgi:NAD(P)-dependent dehydrogenase (short-subunit alcohol dehydrogenase family)